MRPGPPRTRLAMAAVIGLAATSLVLGAQAPGIDLAPFRAMTWRPVGPFHGGPTTAATGVPTDLHLFYAGTVAGGLFRTTDAGRTWQPLFDDQPTGAIGSIAVAATDPSVIYVGTGAAPEHGVPASGDGLYRSNDSGRTWARLGLADSHHIPAVIVDPGNADRLFVAAAGSPFEESDTRGVFRSTDSGRSFTRVLSGNDRTGALDVTFAPGDAAVVYATLVDPHLERDGVARHGPGTGVHKSTDGGTTWRSSSDGLPTVAADGLRRVHIAVAAGSRQRIFALVDARDRGGLYRSDDGAASWMLVNASADIVVAARRGTLTTDPAVGDGVYVVDRQVWRSPDGGRTFATWSDRTPGAGGRLWINPFQPGLAILTGSRGAVVTVNGGNTWSTAMNQPTGRLVAVATDNAFPYRICARDRVGPPGCVPHRGPGGRIGPGDWQPVGLAPGDVMPDPQDPDVVYTGALARFDRRTGQVQDVRPLPAPGEQPTLAGRMAASADARTLYYATNLVWRATGGQPWAPMSPPLGPVSALTPSSIDSRLVWLGTGSGTVHATRDAGVTWSSAGLPDLTPSSRVSNVEASHFDTNTAYVSVDDGATGDTRPRLWRTRDGGATWVDISAGLPAGAVVHAVREDSFRRGLLFAATARSIFVSFDDGDGWRPLRLNLPPVPVTDVRIKEADVVVSTDGRGLWVLDDISAFRQITADIARQEVFLFRPTTAWRTHTAGHPAVDNEADNASVPNPPDGVALSYLVGREGGDLTIEVVETATGEIIRRFSNLATTAGFHRITWDLRHTPTGGLGVRVMPGTYQVRLTAGTRVSRQAVIVRMDPRVRASVTDLGAQFKLSRAVDERRRRVAMLRGRLAPESSATAAATEAARDLDRALVVLQQADTRPTAAVEAAALAAIERADAVLGGSGPDPTDAER